MESIAYNCNSLILWEKTGCGKYNIKNISATGFPLVVVISSTPLSFTQTTTLQPLEQKGFTLDKDGVYDLTVSVMNGTTVVSTYKDYLYEYCRLQTCFNKLLLAVYDDCTTLIKDPCKKKCGVDCTCKTKNKTEDKGKVKKQSRQALEELKSMLLVLFSYTWQYRTGYSFLSLQESAMLPDTLITNAELIKTLYEKINDFTQACGFTCEPADTNCTDCP